MRNLTLIAAVLAAFLMPASGLTKDPPKPDHTRPPERIIGPIIGPWRPIIGIPPCLVDAKLPCEIIEGSPMRGADKPTFRHSGAGRNPANNRR